MRVMIKKKKKPHYLPAVVYGVCMKSGYFPAVLARRAWHQEPGSHEPSELLLFQ